MAVNHNYFVSQQLVVSDPAIDVHLTGQLTASAITVRRRFKAGWGTASAMVGSSAWRLESISSEWSQSSPANQLIPNTCMIDELLWSCDLTYLIMVARGKLDHYWSQSLCFLEISFALRILQVPGALIITNACYFFIVVAGVDWLVILRISSLRCFAVRCRVGAQDWIVFVANARSKHWLRLRHL